MSAVLLNDPRAPIRRRAEVDGTSASGRHAGETRPISLLEFVFHDTAWPDIASKNVLHKAPRSGLSVELAFVVRNGLRARASLIFRSQVSPFHSQPGVGAARIGLVPR